MLVHASTLLGTSIYIDFAINKPRSIIFRQRNESTKSEVKKHGFPIIIYDRVRVEFDEH